jgi:hypothetical protein
MSFSDRFVAAAGRDVGGSAKAGIRETASNALAARAKEVRGIIESSATTDTQPNPAFGAVQCDKSQRRSTAKKEETPQIKLDGHRYRGQRPRMTRILTNNSWPMDHGYHEWHGWVSPLLIRVIRDIRGREHSWQFMLFVALRLSSVASPLLSSFAPSRPSR